MNAKENGGPAFPAQFFDERATGMTLRDYFAAKSLTLAWNTWHEGYFDLSKDQEYDVVHRAIASIAYDMADAMIEARK